jgi:branched-chain amino acid transport system ATP-binding protein
MLMLDEPSLGLAPAVADAIFEVVVQIHRERGLAILLVEQRVAEALESCNRGYVMESGRMVMTGTHDTLIADPRIRQTYLGM